MEPLNEIPRDHIRIGDTLVKEIIYNNEIVYPIKSGGLKFIEWVATSTVCDAWNTNTIMHRTDFLSRIKTPNIHVIMNCDLYCIHSDPDNYINGTTGFFGTRINYNDREYRCMSGGSSGFVQTSIGLNAWNTDGGYQYDVRNPYYSTHGFHKLEADGTVLKIDDQVICTCRAGDNTYTRGNLAPWSPYCGRRMIKNTTMWADGVKIYEYQAAKKDGIRGLYDLVGRKFYGDETFIGSE